MWIILFCEVYSRQYIFFIDRVCFDVQVFVYTCAPLSDEFETTDSKPGFGHQNQFCVVLRSVLFLQKTLSNGDDDLIGFFDFFTIEKREFLQHVFLYVAPQSAINRISTSTPRSTLHYHFIQTPIYANTTYQCRTHINIASILLLCNLLSMRSLDTTLIQKISLYATSFPRRFHATPTTLERRAPCHNTACFVTARLAVQLNGIIQNHSTCRFVVTTQLHFHQVINHNACCRKGIFKNCCSQFIPFDFIHRYSQSNGYTPKLRPTTRLFPVPPTSLVLHNCILQVVNRCSLFIRCFFKKNCFVTPSFNTVGFTHIDYVSNDIEISMTYQSDKHVVSCSCATP